eukprot:4439593-Prymnesium_polylepis.3
MSCALQGLPTIFPAAESFALCVRSIRIAPCAPVLLTRSSAPPQVCHCVCSCGCVACPPPYAASARLAGPAFGRLLICLLVAVLLGLCGASVPDRRCARTHRLRGRELTVQKRSAVGNSSDHISFCTYTMSHSAPLTDTSGPVSLA